MSADDLGNGSVTNHSNFQRMRVIHIRWLFRDLLFLNHPAKMVGDDRIELPTPSV